MSIALDMRIEDDAWNAVEGIADICARAFEVAARTSGEQGEVSLLLTGDDAMRVLNRDWRGKDKPTDVLSFESAQEDRPFLGDIAVGFGVASRDAETKRIKLDQHLSHLLIHGFLHLLGHDHIDDTQAAEMEALEVEALASLGWPDPYK